MSFQCKINFVRESESAARLLPAYGHHTSKSTYVFFVTSVTANMCAYTYVQTYVFMCVYFFMHKEVYIVGRVNCTSHLWH